MLFERYTTCRPNEKIFQCWRAVLILQGILTLVVQKPFEARIHPAKLQKFRTLPLEDEFQSELNQAWICPRSGAGYHPEVPIVGGAADCVGRGELRSIEDVEELRSKFEAEPVVGSEPCSLE
jgi:hypothetical protein